MSKKIILLILIVVLLLYYTDLKEFYINKLYINNTNLDDPFLDNIKKRLYVFFNYIIKNK